MSRHSFLSDEDALLSRTFNLPEKNMGIPITSSVGWLT